MRAEHMELLQSPWLIELGAFCLNFKGSKDGDYPSGFSTHFSFNVDAAPTMTLMLPDSIKLEYDLTCPICLVNFLLLAVGMKVLGIYLIILWIVMMLQETLFDPYALGCGHLFCKSCVCLAASVMICDGPKAASPESKCPVCREVCV